ncbi:MAG: ATP-binding protein [Anaeromicrobium sp.]|jgi:signal transduction histidine kinase|uniref:ATP-binding protein n=1 Tax=Anaeromicrobium sp. TaxID=1929132 RepID=UPI0025EEC82E|nr:ATP-binding protein [Anaeromicrobium sp.]MCT4593696.1 ATP-binding protein [Anaeromicrobium sp.]
MAKEKDINITFEYEDKIMGNVDEEKLLRVFINIIGNSLRYAKNNIIIKVVGNEDLKILIIDDGIGIKTGEESKIFERFYKSTGGKTGLGLYIGKVIINRHKGTIIAYNNESGGATFQINLGKS